MKKKIKVCVCVCALFGYYAHVKLFLASVFFFIFAPWKKKKVHIKIIVTFIILYINLHIIIFLHNANFTLHHTSKHH